MTSPLAASARPTTALGGPLHLGFLTVLHEPTGYLGGYLVTNTWGRPLEFRLSSAVQPNRVQQILYAGTLEPYLFAELIGKALVDKAGTPVQLLVTDREPVLHLRERCDTPVVWLAPPELPVDAASVPVRLPGGGPTLLCHPRHADDAVRVRSLVERLDRSFDFAEPFARVREAIGEARKLSAAGRSAA